MRSAKGSGRLRLTRLGGMQAGNGETENVILAVGEPGGNGCLRDLCGNVHRVNDPARTHEKYLR